MSAATGRDPQAIIAAYDAQAATLAERYARTPAATVHGPCADLVSGGAGRTAMDVGAGSGRDAQWLASLGYRVLAVEPAAGMRREGRRRHRAHGVRWLDDRLPELARVRALGMAFDLVLLSAVWLHVPPGQRSCALRNVAALTKPGALVLLSLRHGPEDATRPSWETLPDEVEALAPRVRMEVVRAVECPDRQGRPDVRWTAMALRRLANGEVGSGL